MIKTQEMQAWHIRNKQTRYTHPEPSKAHRLSNKVNTSSETSHLLDLTAWKFA